MARLFPEPFDLDEIADLVYDDEFMAIVHLMVGREDNWREALNQVNRLLTVLEEDERDDTPAYRIISILAQRTTQFAKPAELMTEITTTIGLLPGINLSQQQIEAFAPPMSQEDRDKKWLEDYRASRS